MRKQQSLTSFFFRSVILIFFVTIAELLEIMRPAQAWGEKMVLPLSQLGAEVVHGAELPYQIVTKNFERSQRIQDLESRYAEALAQLGELDRLKTENQELHALLKDNPGQVTERVIAPIIDYGNPTIGIGTDKNIGEGNMVLIDGTLIGRTGQVNEHQAEVLLFSSKNTVPILAKTEHGVIGTVVGDGKHVLITQLPVEMTVGVGERITTVGQPGVDSDLSIGEVASVEKKNDSPTQTATIDQLVSFYENQLVEVRQ